MRFSGPDDAHLLPCFHKFCMAVWSIVIATLPNALTQDEKKSGWPVGENANDVIN